MFRTAKITVTTNGVENTYFVKCAGANHSQIIQVSSGETAIVYDGDEQRGWGWLDNKIEELREFAGLMDWQFDVTEEF